MIDVTNRSYVAVRLGAIKFFFRHFRSSSAAKALYVQFTIGAAEAAP
jgi:hypothetical protein